MFRFLNNKKANGLSQSEQRSLLDDYFRCVAMRRGWKDGSTSGFMGPATTALGRQHVAHLEQLADSGKLTKNDMTEMVGPIRQFGSDASKAALKKMGLK